MYFSATVDASGVTGGASCVESTGVTLDENLGVLACPCGAILASNSAKILAVVISLTDSSPDSLSVGVDSVAIILDTVLAELHSFVSLSG